MLFIWVINKWVLCCLWTGKENIVIPVWWLFKMVLYHPVDHVRLCSNLWRIWYPCNVGLLRWKLMLDLQWKKYICFWWWWLGEWFRSPLPPHTSPTIFATKWCTTAFIDFCFFKQMVLGNDFSGWLILIAVSFSWWSYELLIFIAKVKVALSCGSDI